MYVRSTADGRGGVRIPENYSGHAFRDQNPYGDMQPPTRVPVSPSTAKDSRAKAADTEIAYAEALQREEIDSDSSAFFPDPEGQDSSNAEPHRHESEGRAKSVDSGMGEEKRSSIFSSLLPQVTSSSRFPFGHGIGSEELLILALMLIIYLSDEADEELLLLLGFLLFAG